jgi:hypothetical protein
MSFRNFMVKIKPIPNSYKSNIKKCRSSKRSRLWTMAVIFVLLLFSVSISLAPSFAAEGEALDDILGDFDDNPSELSDNPSEDVLDGFDDPPEDARPGPTEDDFLEGFDDKIDQTESPKDEDIRPGSIFSLAGYVKLGSAYAFAHDKPENSNTDWRGLSRLRTDLNLELNARFSKQWQARITGKGAWDAAYAIKGRGEFTDDVMDHYEKEFELGETYVQGSLTDRLDIKFGRQVVVWGKSDNIRVTDVLNSLDLREPGITDIEDLRLPVTMTRLDYYIGNWSVTGIALHEIRFNKNPEYGNDFYPGAMSPPHDDKPDYDAGNTEYAASINGIFSGWDISFYGADYYNDTAHVQLVSPGVPPVVNRKHARLEMVGAAFNIAKGNWLFKTEAAWIQGFKFFNAPGKSYSRTDILAGLEYAGFTDTTLTIEAVNRHINGFDKTLKSAPDSAQPDECQWTARATRNFLNDTLTFTLLLSTCGSIGQDGAYQRFTAEYDITDFLQISGGVILYESGDLAAFKAIGDNDRLFCDIRYSF